MSDGQHFRSSPTHAETTRLHTDHIMAVAAGSGLLRQPSAPFDLSTCVSSPSVDFHAFAVSFRPLRDLDLMKLRNSYHIRDIGELLTTLQVSRLLISLKDLTVHHDAVP